MEQCPICLLDLEHGIKEVSCCKNKFHEICYNTWILKNPTCPMCRETKTTEIKNIIIVLAKRIIIIIFILFCICYMVYKALQDN